MLASRAHLAGELNANPFGDMAHHSLFPNVLEIFAARACAGPMPLNIQQKNPQIHMNVVVSAFHHDDGAGPQRRPTYQSSERKLEEETAAIRCSGQHHSSPLCHSTNPTRTGPHSN